MSYRPRSSSVTSQSSVEEGSSPELRALVSPSRLRRNASEKNPVIMAMIKSNTLRSCNDVQDMVIQCMNSRDDKSFMCKTAQSYIANCSK